LVCISIDVFSYIPSKIPAWRLSQKKLSSGGKLLEDAAQLLEEIGNLDSPVFRDRGAEVPDSYRYPDLALEIRAAAKGLRQLKPIGHRPDLVKVNECAVSLCDLLKKQTGQQCRKEVGYLVKAAFPDWKAGASLGSSEPGYSLENSVKQILKRYRPKKPC